MTLETPAIMKLLPWRRPFLMIDRMLSCTPERRIVTLKAIRAGDLLAPGASFPGVLLVEGLSQSAALLFRLTWDDLPPTLPLLGYLKASMHAPAACGDLVQFEVHAEKMTRAGGLFRGESRRGEELLAEAELGFAASRDGEGEGGTPCA